MIWYEKKHNITIIVALNLLVKKQENFHYNKTKDRKIISRNLVLKSNVNSWKQNANLIHWLSYMGYKINVLANTDKIYTREKTNMENIFFLMKNDVVCFRDSAEFLINYKWYQSKEKNVTEEAVRIVKKSCQNHFRANEIIKW